VLAPLGVMSFAPGRARPTAGARLQKVSSISWAAGVAITRPARFFFQQARPPAPVELMQRQVKAIQSAVGASTDVGQEPVPAANPPPGGGLILTFIQV
jgi:hypothetical protein